MMDYNSVVEACIALHLLHVKASVSGLFSIMIEEDLRTKDLCGDVCITV